MPSLIERRNQDISGVRIKYAGLNVIVEEIAHFAPSPVWEDAMLHGDYHHRTGQPHDHPQGAPLRLNGKGGM
jgi:hypothetical protein